MLKTILLKNTLYQTGFNQIAATYLNVRRVPICSSFIECADAPIRATMMFQDPATGIMEGIIDLHHDLFFFLVIVTFFVLSMVIQVLYFFNLKTNKTWFPIRITHDAPLEIIWTIIPTLILIIVAIPSFSLLYAIDEVHDPTITFKAIGHQWYWHYEYTDPYLGDRPIVYESRMLTLSDLMKLEYGWGKLRLLEVTRRLILPKDLNIRGIFTSKDVLHSWTVPSFGIKIDACPGRLNSVVFHPTTLGTYWGQCSEICGVGHGFMPIGVQVVTPKHFVLWLYMQTVRSSDKFLEVTDTKISEDVNSAAVSTDGGIGVDEASVVKITEDAALISSVNDLNEAVQVVPASKEVVLVGGEQDTVPVKNLEVSTIVEKEDSGNAYLSLNEVSNCGNVVDDDSSMFVTAVQPSSVVENLDSVDEFVVAKLGKNDSTEVAQSENFDREFVNTDPFLILREFCALLFLWISDSELGGSGVYRGPKILDSVAAWEDYKAAYIENMQLRITDEESSGLCAPYPDSKYFEGLKFITEECDCCIAENSSLKESQTLLNVDGQKLPPGWLMDMVQLDKNLLVFSQKSTNSITEFCYFYLKVCNYRFNDYNDYTHLVRKLVVWYNNNPI